MHAREYAGGGGAWQRRGPASGASWACGGQGGAGQLGLPRNKIWHVKATEYDLSQLSAKKELWDETDPMRMVRAAAKLGLIMTFKNAKRLIVETLQRERVRPHLICFMVMLTSNS